MRILSIQSQVVFGHVGNSAVIYPLQRLGHEVWAVPTAILSNHAGYPDMGGRAVMPEEVKDLLEGLQRRGAFARCDLVVTGYLSRAETVAVATDAIAQLRAANPDLVYCCDPVMGDREPGLYVDAALPEHLRTHALPVSDVATPNLFELELLCGLEPDALHGRDARLIADAARQTLETMRPGASCLVTSAVHRALDSRMAAAMAVDGEAAWIVEMPELAFDAAPHGAGDLVGALFAAALAEHGQLRRALEKSVAIVFAILDESRRRGSSELELVAAGDAIVAPAQQFTARLIT